MKGGQGGGYKRGSGATDQNNMKESLLGDFLTLNSILRKTNISNTSCSMNAEKVAEHGTNGVNRLNSSQQFTYAKVATLDRVKNTVNFHSLESEVGDVDAYLIIPMTLVQEVNERFSNSLYGYFIGKRIAYPLFESKQGLDDLLENGPYMIRNVLIILKKWSPDANLSKEDLTKVSMWVKIYNVPMVAFTSKGLSMIATKFGKPIMLDSYTSSMCMESWGRGSSARALIELDATRGLKDRDLSPYF
ncbi:zinc knuckle CX2CX4HX4C containing protein [Tanacetum coccineum]